MTTMTEDEILASTVPIIEQWFEETKIVEACFEEENKLDKLYGEGNHMCPYFEVLIQMAVVNQAKGWSKEELLENIGEHLDRMEEFVEE